MAVMDSILYLARLVEARGEWNSLLELTGSVPIVPKRKEVILRDSARSIVAPRYSVVEFTGNVFIVLGPNDVIMCIPTAASIVGAIAAVVALDACFAPWWFQLVVRLGNYFLQVQLDTSSARPTNVPRSSTTAS
jgi:hypothetical protein